MLLPDIEKVLNAHAVYLSDENEDEIIENGGGLITAGTDAADLAIRTCLCGARIDGFDEYTIHLKDEFRKAFP